MVFNGFNCAAILLIGRNAREDRLYDEHYSFPGSAWEREFALSLGEGKFAHVKIRYPVKYSFPLIFRLFSSRFFIFSPANDRQVRPAGAMAMCQNGRDEHQVDIGQCEIVLCGVGQFFDEVAGLVSKISNRAGKKRHGMIGICFLALRDGRSRVDVDNRMAERSVGW